MTPYQFICTITERTVIIIESGQKNESVSMANNLVDCGRMECAVEMTQKRPEVKCDGSVEDHSDGRLTAEEIRNRR
jgi:hypothetical protein